MTPKQLFCFLLLLIIYLGEVVSSSSCIQDEDCQDDTQVCSVGQCCCRPGWVAWKWECHPLVGLGEDCITSVQCKSQTTPSNVCNPINHKCSCERGFTPTIDSLMGLVCLGVEQKQMDHQGYIEHLLDVQNNWPLEKGSKKSIAASKRPNLTQPVKYSQIQPPAAKESPAPNTTLKVTWMLISLLILGCMAALVVSVLYLKTLQEKRASQARVKSLLKIVAEHNDLRPSITSLTSFNTNMDVEDEVYQSYPKREESLLESGRWRNSFSFLTDRPPSYEDLLK